MAKLSPAMQKQMESAVKQAEDNYERASKDPKLKTMMIQSYQKGMEDEQNSYQKRLADYEKKYLVNPNVLIANRLRQFLDVSKDVAFNAQLAPSGNGKMKFADPRYEIKSRYWKLCYRAGREPVEAARTFAAEWLRQIEGR